jgi:hypothetical protein
MVSIFNEEGMDTYGGRASYIYYIKQKNRDIPMPDPFKSISHVTNLEVKDNELFKTLQCLCLTYEIKAEDIVKFSHIHDIGKDRYINIIDKEESELLSLLQELRRGSRFGELGAAYKTKDKKISLEIGEKQNKAYIKIGIEK